MLNIYVCSQALRRGSLSGGQSVAGLSQREAPNLSPRRKPKKSRYESTSINLLFRHLKSSQQAGKTLKILLLSYSVQHTMLEKKNKT